MIRARIGRLGETQAEAILRPVRSDLEALTPESRALALEAGAAVAAQLQSFGEVPPGSALITPAGELGAAFLIHAVLQAPDTPVTETIVHQALEHGLRRTEEWSIASVALPPLGNGAGQLDTERVCAIMVPTLQRHVKASDGEFSVDLVLSNDYELDVFRSALRRDA